MTPDEDAVDRVFRLFSFYFSIPLKLVPQYAAAACILINNSQRIINYVIVVTDKLRAS